jgi:GH25 family lysozyme M1 (1,4-beta-N-acetylmuramidase)
MCTSIDAGQLSTTYRPYHRPYKFVLFHDCVSSFRQHRREGNNSDKLRVLFPFCCPFNVTITASCLEMNRVSCATAAVEMRFLGV